MRKLLLFITLLLSISFIGCAPKQMYSWGNYSDTLYAYKKDSNDETLMRHLQELNKIIEESKKHDQRVPPGVYGELGYLSLKGNKPEKAIEYFNAEKQLYPESTVLMDRLIKKSEPSIEIADDESQSNSKTNQL
ncbi:MAG: DUF4810 domain-containing protein [Nitrospira sp.]|nr:DUF4810 domain-containing protein [Nitrospira sp.]